MPSRFVRGLQGVSGVVTSVGLIVACGLSSSSTFEGMGDPCGGDRKCGEGLVCGPSGTCVAATASSATSDNPTFGGGLGEGDGAAPTGEGDGGVCGQVAVAFTPTTPIVGLVIDKSQSMICGIEKSAQLYGSGDCPNGTKLGTSSRWTILGNALFASTGPVKSLESQVYFGAYFFGPSDGCGLDANRTVAPTLGNFAAIQAKFASTTPDSLTPTGAAVEQTTTSLAGFDPKPDLPKYMVLATDGYPTACGNEDALQRVVNAVTAAYGKGIKTYVVGIGVGLAAQNANFQKIANVGLGFPASTPAAQGAKYFLAANAQDLTSTLDTLIRGVRSCVFDLDSRIDPAGASRGTVTVDGQAKTFGDPDGWKLEGDDDKIEFVGTACTQILAGAASVAASFPCDAGVVKLK